MTGYVQRAEKARKICEDNDLYLLHVPKCRVVDFERSIVMEEMVDLLDGSEQAQSVCYQWAINDSQLKPYIKELFRQLDVFICLMDFADVKHNNVSLMKDGRVALFDLDEDGAVTGLTKGCARGQDGLFSMLPLEWFEDFVAVARPHLTSQEFDKLQAELPRLRMTAQSRDAFTQDVAAFYRTQSITVPTQALVFDANVFKDYKPEVRLFVEKAIECINQQISSLAHLSMVSGRKILIKMNVGDKFFKDFVEHPFFNNKSIWGREFDAVARESLAALQEKGYILSHEFNTNYHYFSVIC